MKNFQDLMLKLCFRVFARDANSPYNTKRSYLLKYKKFLFFLLITVLALGSPLKISVEITKQMLEENMLQTEKYGGDLTLKFLPASIESFDGDIVFDFDPDADDDNEIFSYKLIDGKIVYYTHDGCKHRITLLSIKNKTWKVIEEVDIYGDDKQFGFGAEIEKTYVVKKLGQTQDIKKSIPPSYIDEPLTIRQRIDQLTMSIYGRTDVRIESRREHIDNINNFLHTASLILIKKHKIDIQLEEIRQHQMAAVGTPPEFEGLMRTLFSLENLDGITIIDYDGNKPTTMAELKQLFNKAERESIDFQWFNYMSENDREDYIAELEELLARSGTAEEKDEMKKAEISRRNYDYTYYKNLLDTSSVWCLANKNASIRKPLFFPKTFIIEHLYRRYKAELLHSHNPYDDKEVLRRSKRFEEKSKEIKRQFDRDYLFDLQKKPDGHRSK